MMISGVPLLLIATVESEPVYSGSAIVSVICNGPPNDMTDRSLGQLSQHMHLSLFYEKAFDYDDLGDIGPLQWIDYRHASLSSQDDLAHLVALAWDLNYEITKDTDARDLLGTGAIYQYDVSDTPAPLSGLSDIIISGPGSAVLTGITANLWADDAAYNPTMTLPCWVGSVGYPGVVGQKVARTAGDVELWDNVLYFEVMPMTFGSLSGRSISFSGEIGSIGKVQIGYTLDYLNGPYAFYVAADSGNDDWACELYNSRLIRTIENSLTLQVYFDIVGDTWQLIVLADLKKVSRTIGGRWRDNFAYYYVKSTDTTTSGRTVEIEDLGIGSTTYTYDLGDLSIEIDYSTTSDGMVSGTISIVPAATVGNSGVGWHDNIEEL